jgi:hypothetical protein
LTKFLDSSLFAVLRDSLYRLHAFRSCHCGQGVCLPFTCHRPLATNC